MFKEPITEITFEKVEDFCKEGLPEGIRLDYKEDFPRDLAKTIATFANTYGGLIFIGVEETDQGTPKLPIKGIPWERGLVERVTGIAFRGIYPPVFPEIKVCEFPSKGAGEPDRAVVVIRVQESADAPHAIENKTKVYIRVERQNEPYDLANVDQIIALKARRQEAAESRLQMIESAFERFRNVLGFDVKDKPTLTTIIAPLFPHEPLVSLDGLYRIATTGQPDPRLNLGSPRTVQGGIMFAPFRSEDNFAYMELNQQGLVFYSAKSIPGHQEEIHPAKVVSILARVVEYALYCYENMGFWGLIKVGLTSYNTLNNQLFYGQSWEGLIQPSSCLDPNIHVERQMSVSELKEDYRAVIGHFLREFSSAFGYIMPEDRIKEIIGANVK